MNTVQSWAATNDENGNPRRVYVELNSEGRITRSVDEGYEGKNAAPWVREYARHHMIEVVKVCVNTYRMWSR